MVVHLYRQSEVTMFPESSLPQAILDNASLRGNEYAWQQADVIATIQAAATQQLASIGGQAQFRFPNGTYEMYWLNYDASLSRLAKPGPTM
jgi:hypothetical protein